MAFLYLLYAAILTVLLLVPFRLFPSDEQAAAPRTESRFAEGDAPALHPERYPIRSVIAVSTAAENLADVPAKTSMILPQRPKVWPLKAAPAPKASSRRASRSSLDRLKPLPPRRPKPAKPAEKKPDTARVRTAERLYGFGDYAGALRYFEAALREDADVLSAAERNYIRRRLRDCGRELKK